MGYMIGSCFHKQSFIWFSAVVGVTDRQRAGWTNETIPERQDKLSSDDEDDEQSHHKGTSENLKLKICTVIHLDLKMNKIEV